eukprot:48618_1
MFSNVVKNLKYYGAKVGIGSSLDDLQDALTLCQSSNDPQHVIHFIDNLGKFWGSDKTTATEWIRTAFWKETTQNKYEFTLLFDAISTANHLTSLMRIASKDLIRYIFEENNEQILSRYPLSQLLDLLPSFYSDTFAVFVYSKFPGFSHAPLEMRVSFLSNISIHIAVAIYNNENMTDKELMCLFDKMIVYMERTDGRGLYNDMPIYGYIRQIEYELKSQIIPQNIYVLCNKYANYKQTFLSIARRQIKQNIASTRTEDLYSVFDHQLLGKVELNNVILEINKRRQTFQNQLFSIQRSMDDHQRKLSGLMYVPSKSQYKDYKEHCQLLENHIQQIQVVYSRLDNALDKSKTLQLQISLLADIIQQMKSVQLNR